MVAITITIPTDKIDEFKAGFLKAYPKEVGDTDLQHIKKFIRVQLINYYRTGKILIAQESTPVIIDEEVVNET